MSQTTQTAWPEGVIARYLTVAGASLGRDDLTVDIEYATASGIISVSCVGCTFRSSVATDGRNYDTPEQEQERVAKCIPAAREQAQSHAETCRAMPRPTA